MVDVLKMEAAVRGSCEERSCSRAELALCCDTEGCDFQPSPCYG